MTLPTPSAPHLQEQHQKRFNCFIAAKLIQVIRSVLNMWTMSTQVSYTIRRRRTLRSAYYDLLIFDKKNRYIAWNGHPVDRLILKNLDIMSRKYPKWIKHQIAILLVRNKIAVLLSSLGGFPFR